MDACPARIEKGRITVVHIFYFDSAGRYQMYRIWSDQVAEYLARIESDGGKIVKDLD